MLAIYLWGPVANFAMHVMLWILGYHSEWFHLMSYVFLLVLHGAMYSEYQKFFAETQELANSWEKNAFKIEKKFA